MINKDIFVWFGNNSLFVIVKIIFVSIIII